MLGKTISPTCHRSNACRLQDAGGLAAAARTVDGSGVDCISQKSNKVSAISCSISGVAWSCIRRENLEYAPTVLGDIEIVPMVPVDSVTASESSAPNQ